MLLARLTRPDASRAVTTRALPPAGRPLVVAHRGASSRAAEHTLAAYEAAIRAGADALECDVRLTRDGHLVCVHDRTVDRTSDGHGVVSDLDLERLARLDFASWHADLPDSADALVAPPATRVRSAVTTPSDGTTPANGSAPTGRTSSFDGGYYDGVAADRDEHGGVLTLAALLELVHDSGRVGLLIETKHPTRYAGLVEKTLVEQLAHHGWTGGRGSTGERVDPEDPATVTVMSFAPTALRRIRLLAPGLRTVLLLDRLLPLRRDALLPAGVSVAGPGLHLLRRDPGFVERAHARGVPVYVWTVDEPADVRFVLDLGVDAVITDRPEDVVATLS